MLVTIRQSGGLAGFDNELVATVDTDALAEREAQRIKTAVGRIAAMKESPIGTDMLRFDIEVDEHGKHRSLTIMDDGDAANPIRALLQAVTGVP